MTRNILFLNNLSVISSRCSSDHAFNAHTSDTFFFKKMKESNNNENKTLTWYVPMPMCLGSIFTSSAIGSWTRLPMDTVPTCTQFQVSWEFVCFFCFFFVFLTKFASHLQLLKMLISIISYNYRIHKLLDCIKAQAWGRDKLNCPSTVMINAAFQEQPSHFFATMMDTEAVSIQRPWF